MKKLISLILTISIIASVFVFPAQGLASGINFLVAESYNNIPTGKIVENSSSKSDTAIVTLVTEGKDKAVEMAAFGDSSLSYKIESSSKVLSMYAELNFDKAWSATTFYVMNSSNNKFTLAYIDETGSLYSGDKRLYCVFPKNIKSSIQLTYDMSTKRVSIYMNEKCLESDRYLGVSAYSQVSGFGIDVTQSEGSALLTDNFAIFEGGAKIKASNVPQKAFNPDVYAVLTPGVEEEYVGETVFFTRTFDEENRPEFDGLTTKKNSETTIEKSLIGNNKYLKLKKTSAENNIMFTGDKAARYIIMSADYSTSSNTPAGALAYSYDEHSANLYNILLRVNGSGGVTTNQSESVAQLVPNKWVNIAVALDVKRLKYDIYVDGELKFAKKPFSQKDVKEIQLFVIGGKGAGAAGDILVDNILVYEGKEPREIDASVRKSLLPSDNEAITSLGSSRAINPYSGIMHIDRAKSVALHDIIREENDTVAYAHEDDLKVFFGDAVKLTSPHSSEDGYYNIEETGLASGFRLQKIDTRIMIFNVNPVNVPQGKHKELLRYMTGLRPKAAELTETFNKTSAGKHPRVLINADDLERIKSLYLTDPNMKLWGDNAIAKAEAMMTKPDYTYDITAQKAMPDARSLLSDIRNIAIAYHLTHDQRYVDKAWSMLDKACSLDMWNRYSQLYQGEMGYAIAIGYDWLFDCWTDAQKKRLEEKLFSEGLQYTEKIYYGDYAGVPDSAEKGWWGSTNNWNFVCNGTGIAMASALYDVYPDVAASLIENAIHSLEYASQSFYPYGAWEEGGSYWNYAVTYLICSILTLRSTFGTDYGFSKIPALDKTGWYTPYLAAATGILTLGDSSSGFVTSPATIFLAREFNDATLFAQKEIQTEKLGGVGDALSMVYYDPSLIGVDIELPLDTHMPGAEAVVLREAWYDKGSTAVAAAGGENKRNHGHMDIGSFILDMAGERFVSCTGTEDYNADGVFSTKRYYYYRNKTEGHNLYIINPENSLDYYGAVLNATATSEILVSKPRGSVAQIDLSEAYAPWTNSAVRGLMLSDDRRSVTIRDEISLKQANSDIFWFFHTHAKIDITSENSAVLSYNGKKILATFSSNADSWTLKEVEAVTLNEATKEAVKDMNNRAAGFRKLAIDAKGTGDIYISVKFKQIDDDLVEAAPVDLPISEWTIPDGEVTSLPEAKAIYIDGAPVEGFDPLVTGYARLMSTNATVIPTVTAEADSRVEVTQASEFGGDAIVKVYSPTNPSIYRTYRVNFYKLPPLKDVNGLPRYQVAEITASDIPEPQNGSENVLDGDVDTRWAAEGKAGHWITLELDDTYPINKIGVSWHSGDVRAYKYTIETSLDGVTWTEIFNGASSGKTLQPDYIDAKGVMAKFVRCNCYGNSVNAWNSMTEFEVLGGTGNGTISSSSMIVSTGIVDTSVTNTNTNNTETNNTTPSASNGIYSDLPTSHWSYSSVRSLVNKGIISGYNDNTFRPDNTITRAEYTKLILGAYEAVNGKGINANGTVKVATIGDSLTQGYIGDNGTWSAEHSYPMLLDDMLGDGYEVKNFGLSGYGIYEGHKNFYKSKPEYTASLEYNPDAVIIMMGTNDAKTEYWDTIKNSYKNIYKEFVQTYMNLPSKPTVILGIPTPVFGDGNFAKDRPAEIMAEMRSIEMEVAKELGLRTVNFYEMFLNRETDFPDGLHYNKNGATTVAAEYANILKELADKNSSVSFADVSANDWFAPYVTKAAGLGLVNGSGSGFAPNNNITREDAAVILYRLISKKQSVSGAYSFDDGNNIASYASEAVSALASNGIISGSGNNMFNPKSNLTRAEASKLIFGALTKMGA